MADPVCSAYLLCDTALPREANSESDQFGPVAIIVSDSRHHASETVFLQH
jgi:hypothetical protein